MMKTRWFSNKWTRSPTRRKLIRTCRETSWITSQVSTWIRTSKAWPWASTNTSRFPSICWKSLSRGQLSRSGLIRYIMTPGASRRSWRVTRVAVRFARSNHPADITRKFQPTSLKFQKPNEKGRYLNCLLECLVLNLPRLILKVLNKMRLSFKIRMSLCSFRKIKDHKNSKINCPYPQ